ncbi:MAG TPA: OmpH family outer membrane protein [Phycisphaerae bacterium]|nr:OmpH family outer membrane protein [Phycisphaerae bacterium]
MNNTRMNRCLRPPHFALTMLAVLWSAQGALAQSKIAVIDVASVFESYEMTRDLEAMFNAKRQELATEAEQRRTAIEQMRRGLAAFDPGSADYASREQELIRAEVDFQVWSTHSEQRLKTNHKLWLLAIYRNTQETVGKVADERNYDLVLTYDRLTDDAPDSVTLRQQILLQKVIYHHSRIDITTEVLNRLNNEYKSSGGIRSLDALPATPNRTPGSQPRQMSPTP